MLRSNGGNLTQRQKAPPRILLVDDHEALASVRRLFLIQEGYEVVCARSGPQALRLLATDIFHLVITDSVLPELSGWEVASTAKRRGLPVILSSGWPVRMSVGQLAPRGVDFLCPKPCRLPQLLSIVKKALRQRTAKDDRTSLVPKSQYQSHR